MRNDYPEREYGQAAGNGEPLLCRVKRQSDLYRNIQQFERTDTEQRTVSNINVEMSLTSGEFNAELFSMANKADYEKAEFAVPQTEWLTLDANKQLTLKHTPMAGTISIKGMVQDTTAAEGKYSVEDNKITFAEADITTDLIEVSYDFSEQMEQIIIDNKSAAVGECVLEYPVILRGLVA